MNHDMSGNNSVETMCDEECRKLS